MDSTMTTISIKSFSDLLTSEWFILILFGISMVLIILMFIMWGLAMIEMSKTRKEMLERCSKIGYLTVEEFLMYHNTLGKEFEARFRFTGCFVFTNVTKNKSYVGQSSNVFKRVLQIINGGAIPDLYADIKNGDMFHIIMIDFMKWENCNNIFDMQNQLMSCYNSLDPKGVTGYNLRRPSK